MYVHSPFCARRCPYCDFPIALARQGIAPARYLENLRREVELRASPDPLRTVYVGGGTPTALSVAELDAFFAILHGGLDLSQVREFSVEANPEDVDAAKAAALARHGVNRATLGAQSFDEGVLRFLGRRHRAETTARALGALRDAGIRRVGLDLIIAVPHQDPGRLEDDLRAALALRPDHVSVYCLTFEPGTSMTRARDRGRLHALDAEAELALFRLAHQHLEGAGYRRYEVSNYALPGARCRHNFAYWRNLPYLGLGPGAASYLGGARRRNLPQLREWCEALEQGRDPMEQSECLEPARALRETVMLGLRTRAGVFDRWLRLRHGEGLEALDAGVVRRLLRDGLIESPPGRLRLTARGFELADFVAAELL